jgi:hypothetical protein
MKKKYYYFEWYFFTSLIPLLIVCLEVWFLIPVSVIVGSMFVIMIILLPAMSAIITGQMYQRYILKKEKVIIDFNISALTLIVLTFVGFIPYIGSVVVYLLYIVAFGAMTQYLLRTSTKKKT